MRETNFGKSSGVSLPGSRSTMAAQPGRSQSHCGGLPRERHPAENTAESPFAGGGSVSCFVGSLSLSIALGDLKRNGTIPGDDGHEGLQQTWLGSLFLPGETSQSARPPAGLAHSPLPRRRRAEEAWTAPPSLPPLPRASFVAPSPLLLDGRAHKNQPLAPGSRREC